MIKLSRSATAWDSDAFVDTFKAEVEALGHAALPLQQGLALSSYVSDEPYRVMLINRAEEAGTIRVKAGVFYSGIIAGCSCADDPSPTDVQAEYCDLEFRIDRHSGETDVSLCSED